MNRFNKEEEKKRNKAREGLTPDQIKALDAQEEKEEEVSALARKLHAEQFPEEYDFMLDDHVDADRRKKGENPMSQECQDLVDAKRGELGVTPLAENGLADLSDSMQLCIAEARKILGY